MELDKLKKLQIPVIAGWISIACGLFTLLLLNISMIMNESFLLFDYFSVFMFIGFIFAWPAIFSKNTRFLGGWGIGIIVFLTIFFTNIFFLGWMVVPFP